LSEAAKKIEKSRAEKEAAEETRQEEEIEKKANVRKKFLDEIADEMYLNSV